MEIFHQDDAGYRVWVWANLAGYVVNAQRGSNPGEPILHRSTCDTITPTPEKEWTVDYIKVCSNKLYELEEWGRTVDRRLTSCVFCQP